MISKNIQQGTKVLRKCTMCSELKELVHFSPYKKHNNKNGRLQTNCKPCASSYSNARNKMNRKIREELFN